MVLVHRQQRKSTILDSIFTIDRLPCFASCVLILVLSMAGFLWISAFQRVSEERLNKLRNNRERKAEGNAAEQPFSPGEVITVAYAVSVTGCGSDPITEGAAVLKHAIHRTSIRGQGAGVNNDLKGKYDYQMFAIYHPDAVKCASPLEKLGYTLLERNVFVNVAEIQGDFLREHIQTNGCCGEKELIKLEAYTLTDYPIVVHLDLDVLVLKPMDELFDMMLFPKTDSPPPPFVMWPEKPIPTTINAFYTYDYNMVGAKQPYKPVQGGFLVTRPSLEVYEEFKAIVLKGDFRQGDGWGGIVGPFHGSMTFQGLIPYYYDVLHLNEAVELNRCIYNQMCDNPRTGKTVKDVLSGKCRTNTPDDICEDCRDRPLEDVVTIHFTLCQKPWWCLPHSQDRVQDRLCRKLTREWYRIRADMELSWGRSGFGPYTVERDSADVDQFFGFCKTKGDRGYLPIQEPYGKPLVAES